MSSDDTTQDSGLRTQDSRDPRELLRRAVSESAATSPREPVETIAARHGIAAERIVRLHLNENPYGPPLRVQEALAACDQFHLYPDPDSTDVRLLLAAYTGIGAERIVVAGGADALIDLLLRLFVDSGDAILVPTPTNERYAARAAVHGARVVAVPRREDFALDLAAIEPALTPETKLVFLASPNDPTGNLCRERDIVHLLNRHVIVVVDETSFEFSGRTVAPLTAEYDNLVVLRSLSAWAGLAGLGIAYALMPRWIARAAARVRQSYPVSVAAQVAARAVFDELPYARNTIRRIRLERLRMYRALRKLNFVRPSESKGNYLFVHVLHGGAAALADWLEADGIFVRRFTAPGLRDYVRISVGKPEDTDRLIRRMTQLAQKYAREIGSPES
jgi:histidinol-phosphate aminotransferase